MDIVLLAWLLALTLLAIFFPMLGAAGRACLRFRGREALPCPETGILASVRVHAGGAARTALPGGEPRIRVRDCARWPERRGCPERCPAKLVY